MVSIEPRKWPHICVECGVLMPRKEKGPICSHCASDTRADIHRLESADGISADLSSRWDATMERWFPKEERTA